MPDLPILSRPESVVSDSRSGSIRSASTIRKKYCIVNAEGKDVEPGDLGQYGLRIQIQVEEDDVSVDDERCGSAAGTDRGSAAEHQAHHSAEPATPTTAAAVASEKAPQHHFREHANGTVARAAAATGARHGNGMVDSIGGELCTTSSLFATAPAFQPTPRKPVHSFESSFESTAGTGTPKYNFLAGSVHAPKGVVSRPVGYDAGYSRPSDPAHQYLAGHRVSSYPILNSLKEEQNDDDNNSFEPSDYLRVASATTSQSTITEREQHKSPSLPATPPAQTQSQTDGAVGDNSTALAVDSPPLQIDTAVDDNCTALTRFDDNPLTQVDATAGDHSTAITVFDDSSPTQSDTAVGHHSTALTLSNDNSLVFYDSRSENEKAQDQFVEDLRFVAMEGAQVFNYDGYVAGTKEACLDLSKYVFHCGVHHGLYYAERVRASAAGRPNHGCGGTCVAAQKLRKDLEKEKKNTDWEKWQTYGQKEKNKELIKKHEKEVAMLKKEHEAQMAKMMTDYETQMAAMRGEESNSNLQAEVARLQTEKAETEHRVAQLVEEARVRRSQIVDLVKTVGQRMGPPGHH